MTDIRITEGVVMHEVHHCCACKQTGTRLLDLTVGMLYFLMCEPCLVELRAVISGAIASRPTP